MKGLHLMQNYKDAVLASRQGFLRHLDAELRDDLEDTMATVTRHPTYAIAQNDSGLVTDRMVTVTDHHDLREFYSASFKAVKVAASRLLTNVSSDWYEFIENVPTRYHVSEDEYRTVNSVTLIPRTGDRIQGEFLWERGSDLEEPTPAPVPEELHPSGTIPTVRLRNANLHQNLLDALSEGRIDDAMSRTGPSPLWATRSYAPDAGPAPLAKAEGRDQLRSLLDSWCEMFDIERISTLIRLATEWYVFAEELYTVTVKKGALSGERREFRQAIFYPMSPDGLILGAMGYGTDLVAPSGGGSGSDVGRVSYTSGGFADTVSEP
jgi:hypothetical protein